MSIMPWQRRDCISIDKYMSLELPISRAESGWLKDDFAVVLVDSPKLLLYAIVARAEDGYHSSRQYATPTGVGLNGARAGSPATTKLGALERAIKKCLDDYWVTKHEGNRARLEAALKELDKYKYQQLILL